MEGVEFWHGTRKRKEVFRFEQIEAALRVCIDLTEPPNLNPKLLGVKTGLGTEKLAALFAWTSTPLCYALCSLLRAPHRTRESIKPALPFARLLFAALHALPERFIFKRGTLYRAESGVMDMWDDKMKVGGIFSFFTPTSFSQDAAVVSNFKGEGPRTVSEVHDASGWIMDDFNLWGSVNSMHTRKAASISSKRKTSFLFLVPCQNSTPSIQRAESISVPSGSPFRMNS